MCHEKYHVDPELRALANRLSGLPLASTAEQRERCMTVAQMLLARCCLEGLAFYLEDGYAALPTGEVARLLTKVASIRERLSMEAATMLRVEETSEVPF
jgi:hypothetical protein